MADAYLQKMLATKEKILLETRHHWIYLIIETIPEILLMIALSVLLTFMLVDWLPEHGWLAWGYLLLLFPMVSMTKDILTWFSRKFVVTNRRVIQLWGIFNKNLVDSSLEKVNDVRLSQPLIGRILGYGTIEILTASEMAANRFAQIKDPTGFKTAMLNAKEALDTERSSRD